MGQRKGFKQVDSSWAESRVKALRMKSLATAGQIVDRTVDEVLAIYGKACILDKEAIEDRIRTEQFRQIDKAITEQCNKLREVTDRGQAMMLIGRVKEGMDYWKKTLIAGIQLSKPDKPAVEEETQPVEEQPKMAPPTKPEPDQLSISYG